MGRVRIQLTQVHSPRRSNRLVFLEIQWIDGSDPFKLSESRFPQIHIDSILYAVEELQR